jgi:hypothetical protein
MRKLFRGIGRLLGTLIGAGLGGLFAFLMILLAFIGDGSRGMSLAVMSFLGGMFGLILVNALDPELDPEERGQTPKASLLGLVGGIVGVLLLERFVAPMSMAGALTGFTLVATMVRPPRLGNWPVRLSMMGGAAVFGGFVGTSNSEDAILALGAVLGSVGGLLYPKDTTEVAAGGFFGNR